MELFNGNESIRIVAGEKVPTSKFMTHNHSRDDTNSSQAIDDEQLDSPLAHLIGDEYSRATIRKCQTCARVQVSVASPPHAQCCCNEKGTELSKAAIKSTLGDIPLESPALKPTIQHVFGLPKPAIDLSFWIAEQGPVSAEQTAEAFDYNKSTAIRYLNQLSDLGLLERAQLNRKEGGIVNVYQLAPSEQRMQTLLIGFFDWTGQVLNLLEGMDQKLLERAGTDEQDGPDSRKCSVFWNEGQ